MNRKKTQRLYREEGLAVRRRKSRRRVAVARTPIPLELRMPAVPCRGGAAVCAGSERGARVQLTAMQAATRPTPTARC